MVAKKPRAAAEVAAAEVAAAAATAAVPGRSNRGAVGRPSLWVLERRGGGGGVRIRCDGKFGV